jgi:hypothetical protein
VYSTANLNVNVSRKLAEELRVVQNYLAVVKTHRTAATLYVKGTASVAALVF